VNLLTDQPVFYLHILLFLAVLLGRYIYAIAKIETSYTCK
jgi:hypothetical protein